MMIKKVLLKLSFLGALCFMFLGTANAGLLVEPYLGYELGKVKYDIPVHNLTFDLDQTGAVYGIRLAHTLPLMFFGVDYSIAPKLKQKVSNLNADDVSRQSFYGIAGVSIPFLRGWIGYAPFHQFKDGSDKIKGSAIKIGGSFSMIPLVSVNLEYVRSMMKKVESGGSSINLSSGEVSGNSIILTISVPFSI